MNYGLQLSAAGALTSLYQVDAWANNLANVNTDGFKPQLTYTMQREPARTEDNIPGLPSNTMLERLGGGIFLAPNSTDFSQGGFTATGMPLQAAIDGEGFFAVGSDDDVLLTRDGRFTAADGRLVMATTGLPVLDSSGQPIRIPVGSAASIAPDGQVIVDNEPVARLQIVDAADRRSLQPQGGTLFAPLDPSSLHEIDDPALRTGGVEGSAVDPITAMMKLTSAAKAVGTHMNMIRHHDQLLDRAINTFGRVT